MKKIIMASMVLLLLFPVCALAADAVPKTNIGNTSIFPPNDSPLEEQKGFIKYGDSSEEKLEENYVGLFINGSIVKNANLMFENGRTLLPLRLVAENLGAMVEWEPTTRNVTITDENNTIELFIDNKNARINGEEYPIDVAPQIIDDVTYVPARFVAEALNAKVDYFDGADTTKPHIVIRMRHVMISKYPDSAKIFTKEEAIEKTREQLLIAFEKRFGEYIPPVPGETLSYATGGDKDMLRGVISNLGIASENDRYYVIPVVFDFWFDKYTGDIYMFYNGHNMYISVFDPYAEGALAFAG